MSLIQFLFFPVNINKSKIETHSVFLCAAKQNDKKIINLQCNFCSYINCLEKLHITRLVLFKTSLFPLSYDENITILAAGKGHDGRPHPKKAEKQGTTYRPP